MIDNSAVVDLARRIADELEKGGIPYAIGGALAFNYWGPPRGTKDVDVNIFVGPSEVAAVVPLLHAAGVSVDSAAAIRAAEEGGHAQGWKGPVVADFFFNSIPLHDSAARRVVTRP